MVMPRLPSWTSASQNSRRETGSTPVVAGGGREHAAEDLEGGGLPRAVRADEPEDLADGDLEVDPANGLDRAVALIEPPDPDGHLGRHGAVGRRERPHRRRPRAGHS